MKFKINNLTPFLLAALQNPAFAAGEPQKVMLNIGGTLSVPTCPAFTNLKINLGDLLPLERIKAHNEPLTLFEDNGHGLRKDFPNVSSAGCSHQRIILTLQDSEIMIASNKAGHAGGIKLVITHGYENKSNIIRYQKFEGQGVFKPWSPREGDPRDGNNFHVHTVRSGSPEEVTPGLINARVTATMTVE